jgi:peptide chain release factor 2
MLNELKDKALIAQKKISELSELLDIQKKESDLKALQDKASNPELWDDPKQAQTTLQELKSLETTLNNWKKIKSRADDLAVYIDTAIEEKQDSAEAELDKDLNKLSSDIASLELTTMLGGKYDKNNAIVTINAGAGGTDAQDWAQVLLRMYSRWAEGKDYKIEIPDMSYGEEAGIKGATIFIEGEYAYGYLKAEKGIHRLVRMSPFNSDGKRHTSFASVEVIPEIAEDIKVEIDPNDLRVDTFRASGPGGQNVNKVSSAIRITHIPTGIVTQSQSDRSQHANKETAMKILKAKLYEMLLEERKEKIEELRGKRKDIGWGNQIRSYVFAPYTMVKDHRTGTEISDVQGVIDGDIDTFIKAFLASTVAEWRK